MLSNLPKVIRTGKAHLSAVIVQSLTLVDNSPTKPPNSSILTPGQPAGLTLPITQTYPSQSGTMFIFPISSWSDTSVAKTDRRGTLQWTYLQAKQSLKDLTNLREKEGSLCHRLTLIIAYTDFSC